MKKISLFSLFFIVAVFGCESETESVAEKSTEAVINSSDRVATDVYPEFADLFKSLYRSGYFISDVTTTVASQGVTYRYNTVYSIVNNARVLEGYVLEVPGDVIFYQHDARARKITEHNFTNGRYVSKTFVIGNDPVYNSGGFSPQTAVNSARRFWGWDYSGPGETLHQDPIGGGCYRLMTETYYVLGVGMETREIESLRMPADCS